MTDNSEALHAAARFLVSEADGYELPSHLVTALERLKGALAPAGFAEGVEEAAKWHDDQVRHYRLAAKNKSGANTDNFILLAREHEEAARCIRTLTPAPVTASGAQDSPAKKPKSLRPLARV